ncbi:MAG: DUF5615 family PIN-like protein [Planctomycetes bacterium]|nr:DUF5615 family PIN-like protein [Planctomycetota bacterium]
MSLRLYLDDCAYHKKLVELLRDAGHHVVTPPEAGKSKQEDPVHFEYAIANSLVLLTKNARDFVELHEMNPDHSGIFIVYQDNDPTKDMSNAELVRAIANVVAAGVPIAGPVHSLNAWRF